MFYGTTSHFCSAANDRIDWEDSGLFILAEDRSQRRRRYDLIFWLFHTTSRCSQISPLFLCVIWSLAFVDVVANVLEGVDGFGNSIGDGREILFATLCSGVTGVTPDTGLTYTIERAFPDE